MTQKEAIDYFTEAPYDEVCETANLATVIIKTRELYEKTEPEKKRGRPLGSRNKTAEGAEA